MNTMQEEKFKLDSFIGGWYIDPKICDPIIDYFEKSPNKIEGGANKIIEGGVCKTKFVIDKSMKESTDVYVDAKDSLLFKYNRALHRCLKKYLKKYPEQNNTTEYYSGLEHYNIQKYLPGQGFKKFHCERRSRSHRCLVFMTYLNDVKNGGTEFKYQKIKTQAKKGLTLIWPTDFTHTHRGIISKETKYIITGWYNYLR